MIEMIFFSKFDAFDPLEPQPGAPECEQDPDEFSTLLATLAFTPVEQKTPEKCKAPSTAEDTPSFAIPGDRSTQTDSVQITENRAVNRAFLRSEKRAIETKPDNPGGPVIMMKVKTANTENQMERTRRAALFEAYSPTLHAETVEVQVETRMPSAPFETLPLWMKRGFVNAKSDRNAEGINFLPKLLRQITNFQLKSELKAATVGPEPTVFAPSEVNVLPMKIQTDLTAGNRNLFQGEDESVDQMIDLRVEANGSDVFERVSSSALDRGEGDMAPHAPAITLEKLVLDQASEQIRQEVIVFASKPEKTSTLKLRLHPADLGGVSVKLEKTDSGELRIDFQTESEETRQILIAASENLRESLQDSGWRIGRLDVFCGAFESAAGGRERERRAAKHRAVESAPTDERAREDIDSEASRLVSIRA